MGCICYMPNDWGLRCGDVDEASSLPWMVQKKHDEWMVDPLVMWLKPCHASTSHDWEMVNIPPIKMVMTGGWFMIVWDLSDLTHSSSQALVACRGLCDEGRRQKTSSPVTRSRTWLVSTSCNPSASGVQTDTKNPRVPRSFPFVKALKSHYVVMCYGENLCWNLLIAIRYNKLQSDDIDEAQYKNSNQQWKSCS